MTEPERIAVLDAEDGLYLCAAIGAVAVCLLLHGRLLRALAEGQLELHNDVEFVKTYLKEVEALGK